MSKPEDKIVILHYTLLLTYFYQYAAGTTKTQRKLQKCLTRTGGSIQVRNLRLDTECASHSQRITFGHDKNSYDEHVRAPLLGFESK